MVLIVSTRACGFVIIPQKYRPMVADIFRDYRNQIFEGDCQFELRHLPAESVDLIVTSPPYADQRKGTYGGTPPDKYVDWFMPRAAQFYRILKPTGSFILNIKERVTDGQRDTYVLDLILKLKGADWKWTEEYLWHKKNCAPGKWPNRFRDAWERCLHFTKQKKFYMDQDAVKVEMGDWAESRLKNLSDTDRRRDESRVKSGFGKKVQNWVGREQAYPSNVLHIATECGNQNHSASFPIALPTFFIKLFTKPGDLVVDPFVGSGTTAVAAKKLGRTYFGIDSNPEYVHTANRRLGQTHAKV
jgi:site-specific DNA-methyltransferase (adenine-specific)